MKKTKFCRQNHKKVTSFQISDFFVTKKIRSLCSRHKYVPPRNIDVEKPMAPQVLAPTVRLY